MREIGKYAKICALVFVCMLFLGTGMKVQAAGPAQVNGLQQIRGGSSSVEVSWNAVIADDIRYKVELSADSRFSDAKTEETSGTQRYFSGLSAGSRYYVRVTAYNRKTEEYGISSPVLEVVTAPDDSKCNLKQTEAGTTSITLKWDQKAGVNAYRIEYYKMGNSDAKVTVDLDNVQTYKAANLNKDSEYYFRLYPVMKSASGYPAVSASGESLYGSVQPGKVKGLEAEYWSPTSTSMSLSWDKRDNAKGYQYEIYTASGKKAKKLLTGDVTYNGSTISLSSNKLKKAQFIKIRIRARISLSDGKYSYGAWSSWQYTSKQPKIEIDNVSGGQELTWPKVAGADSYTVQVSTKQKSGYKKVGTIKGNSIIVRKCGKSALKSGKTYYYTVVANKKAGKKTYHGSRTHCYSMVYR